MHLFLASVHFYGVKHLFVSVLYMTLFVSVPIHCSYHFSWIFLSVFQSVIVGIFHMAFVSTMILSLAPMQSHHLSTITRFWSPPVNSGRPASHHSCPVHRLGSERGGRSGLQSCNAALTDIHTASHVIAFCRHQSKFIQLDLAAATPGLGMRHFAWRF